MKIVSINGEMNAERLKQFVDDIKDTDHEHIIYLTSEGGSHDIADTICHMMSRMKVTELVAVGEISSCALWLFFEANVTKKTILPDTFGILHLASVKIAFLANKNPLEETDKHFFEHIKSYKKRAAKLMEDGKLSTAIKKKVMRGDDVALTTEQLQKMLENIQQASV